MASGANQSVLIAAPYIKYDEAVWFCGLLNSDVEVITLANLNAEAVSASTLDVSALRCLAEASTAARLIALSSLHAKVYVADEKAAIVTSGKDADGTRQQFRVMAFCFRKADWFGMYGKTCFRHARLGSQVDVNTLAELAGRLSFASTSRDRE